MQKTKQKFIKLDIELVRQAYLRKSAIKYYYPNGNNPNNFSKKDLEFVLTQDYHFIPNGDLFIEETNYKTGKSKIKKIKDFLGKNFDMKIIDYKNNPDIFYFLSGQHIIDKVFRPKSKVVICSKPLNIISDNCVGGQNWILVDKK
jgi:hypothetical protein